MLSRIFKKSNS